MQTQQYKHLMCTYSNVALPRTKTTPRVLAKRALSILSKCVPSSVSNFFDLCMWCLSQFVLNYICDAIEMFCLYKHFNMKRSRRQDSDATYSVSKFKYFVLKIRCAFAADWQIVHTNIPVIRSVHKTYEESKHDVHTKRNLFGFFIKPNEIRIVVNNKFEIESLLLTKQVH